MVIPTVARQKGITVRLYAELFVAVASAISPFLFSHSASAALLPVSDIPIVGKPVAGVVNIVTDNVVKPVTNTVANALPQPLGTVVQTPVNAITQTIGPVIGPAARYNHPMAEAFETPPLDTPIQSVAQPATPSQQVSHIDQAPIDTPHPKTSQSIASYTPLTLSGYLPAISDMIVKFAANKDLSPFIAAMVIIGLMLVTLGILIAMIIRNRHRAVSTQEMTFIRQDLTQMSLLMTGLLAVGLVLLFYILH